MVEAITHGLTILSWFENNAEKDLPPENIWDDAEGLELHWKSVRQRESDRQDGGTSYDEGSDGPDGGDMLGNDLASVFKD